jgi:hypothetical protein
MAKTTCSCCGETVQQTVQLHSHKEIQICYQCLDWLNMRRDKKVGAHGGGWQVAGFEPIFTVTDIPRSTDHYDKMGFEIGHHDEMYAFAHRDKDLTIHLPGDSIPWKRGWSHGREAPHNKEVPA